MATKIIQAKKNTHSPNDTQNNIKIKPSPVSYGPKDYFNLKNNKTHLKYSKFDKENSGFIVDKDRFISRGKMMQYCVKGSEVILREIYFVKDDKTKTLSIAADNGKQITNNYVILFSKNVCPFNFKDTDAFVLKVLDGQHNLKSMTFKSETFEDKSMWLETYGIELEIAQKLLGGCIEEIEKRRFHLGIKKRNEDRNKIKVNSEILMDLITAIRFSNKIILEDNNKWSVTSLERLIQILLNELTEPLIPYNNQRAIRKGIHATFNAPNETRKLLNTLPNKNRKMLSTLLSHLERLSKYYLIIMGSPRKDLQHIRLNICQRLTPIIFRLQEELDSEIIVSRACDLLYHTMLCVNGATESSDRY